MTNTSQSAATLTFTVEIQQGNYYTGKILVGYFDKTDTQGKIDFTKCETVEAMFKENESEAKGFFRHLANSIRKRCREGNWHLAPKSFRFAHALMADKSTVLCLITPTGV